MSEEQQPAEAFPVTSFIQEELEERGWTWEYLASQMVGDAEINQLAVSLLRYGGEIKGLLLGEEMADELSRLFGTSTEYWLNLDKAWQL